MALRIAILLRALLLFLIASGALAVPGQTARKEAAVDDDEEGSEAVNVVDWLNGFALIAGILVSLATWLLEQRNARNQEAAQRLRHRDEEKARFELELVQRQISVFGPLKGHLLAAKHTADNAKKALKQKRLVPREKIYLDEACENFNPDFRWFEYGPDGEPVDQDPRVVQEWRAWVRYVMLPTTEKMVELINSNIALMPEVTKDGLPAEVSQLIDHTLSYQVLIHEWDQEEAAGGELKKLKSYQNTATVPFPRKLVAYVDRAFEKMLEDRDMLTVYRRSDVSLHWQKAATRMGSGEGPSTAKGEAASGFANVALAAKKDQGSKLRASLL